MEEQNISTGGAFPTAGHKEHIAGPIIGGIILILTIIVAVYFWMGGGVSDPMQDTEVLAPIEGSPSSSTPDSAVEELSSQGTSDEVADIEADLKATNLDTLGEYIDEI